MPLISSLNSSATFSVYFEVRENTKSYGQRTSSHVFHVVLSVIECMLFVSLLIRMIPDVVASRS